jgi:Icc-related predicted phosphoesterase
MNPTILLAVLVSWPLRIAVLGDRTGSPDDAEFEATVAAIEAMSPDVVLTVGDFVEGYGDAATALEDWATVRPFLERLESTAPVIWTPGNNDIWDGETMDMWMDQVGTEPSGMQRAGGVDFLVWDTSMSDCLDENMLSGLETLIGDLHPGSPWILVTHRPIWFMADQDSTVTGEFYELMDRVSPLAVVAGHIHVYASERRDGILYVSAGPSGTHVSDPDVDEGRFTQLGWMTVYPDSAAYAVIDSRGVYPGDLNTGSEQLTSWLYRSAMISCRPLDEAAESAVLTLDPVEGVDRTVAISVDPGCWRLSPDSLAVELGSESVEIAFELGHGSGFYPLPVLSVSLSYGDREKSLEFDYTWPARRSTEASFGFPVIDGSIGDTEYPLGWQSDFADLSGAPAGEAQVRFAAMASAEALSLFAEMPCPADGQAGDDGDYLGLIVDSSGGFYWLKTYRNGEVSSTRIDDDGIMREWSEGYTIAVSETDSGWSAEVALDRRATSLEGDRVGVHVYRVRGQDIGTWAWPLDWNRRTMGEILLGQATTR